MAEKITWSASVVISSGPRVSVSDSLQVEAYDKVTITVESTNENVEVELQPGAADKVMFFMIKSSLYHEKLTYTVEGSTKDLALDAPHLLVGAGAISLLDTDPTKLTLRNDSGDPATIEVIVGRSAT
jgi:hypothetical protein